VYNKAIDSKGCHPRLGGQGTKEISMIEICGVFETPNGEEIDVRFKVREGATREEVNLAFFDALADVGSVRIVGKARVANIPDGDA
jgi:hypothetical protein